MRRRPVYSFFAVALAVVMLTATVSFACGPFAMEAVFTFTVHPSFPLDRFARGEIGVVQPSYARSYLYVAYRQLNGLGFTVREQKAIDELWKERLDLNGDLGAQNAVQVWLTARKKVPGVAEPPKIDESRNREKPNEYESYLNCQKDAFEHAATTLDSRIAKYGVDSPAMKDWVEAQDQVFANCNAGQHI